jgi:hypothetical protein
MVDTTLLTIVGSLGMFANAACVAIYFSNSWQVRTEYRLLGMLLITVLIADVCGFVGGFMMRVNMNATYSIFNLAIATLWFQFYVGKIKEPRLRNVINLVTFGHVIFAIANFFFIQGVSTINSNSFAVSAVLRLVLSLIYYYILIRDLPSDSITRLPMFWINAAVLIYSAGTILINISTEYLVKTPNAEYLNAFIFNNAVTTFHYMLLGIGLFLCKSFYRDKAFRQSS